MKQKQLLYIFFIFAIIFISSSNLSFAQQSISNNGETKTYLQIPEKTVIQLINIDNLSSKKNNKYDIIHFRLLEDFSLNGKIILPKNYELQGLITKIHASRILGESAIIRIRLNDITLDDGTNLQFVPDLKLKGGKNYTSFASSVIVPFSGLLFKGKEIDCPPGSIIEYEF